MNPEELARQKIDTLLTQCGWGVQDYKSCNLSASRVTICTIQRLYSMLRDEEQDGDLEEHSTYEFGA